MKRTILLLLLAVITGIAHISAQYRIYNLETTIVTPDDQEIFTLNEPFDLEFYFKNLGPDSIIADDTLLVQFSGMLSPQTYIVGKTLNPYADTIHFKTSVTVSATNANPINFCVIGQIRSSINADYDFANNSQCRILYFEEKTTGAAELVAGTTSLSAIQIYPNPATDLVRFNYTVKEYGSIILVITDMNGRKIMQTDFSPKNAGDSNISADISTLPPGMYFVEIIESHAKGSGRFLIHR